MTTHKLPFSADVEKLACVLNSCEIATFIEDLEETKLTGRRGYATKALVGISLVKSIYSISTWTRTLALVREHEKLKHALGCSCDSDVPSIYSCYRFTVKLRKHKSLLDKCIQEVICALHSELPEMGVNIAIDGSDIPAYANGRTLLKRNGPKREKFADPDATWSRRSASSNRPGGAYYGYKLHAAVCTKTGLPLAWRTETARDAEQSLAALLVEKVKENGFSANTCALDKGYDSQHIHKDLEELSCRPIIPMREFTKNTHPVTCEHGEWKFAGSDYKRQCSQWRCPTGECEPKVKRIKASRINSLIPRSTERWKKLYRGRSAIEREFGHLKTQWALLPLKVRTLERVKLHVDLTILARLSCALARAKLA